MRCAADEKKKRLAELGRNGRRNSETGGAIADQRFQVNLCWSFEPIIAFRLNCFKSSSPIDSCQKGNSCNSFHRLSGFATAKRHTEANESVSRCVCSRTNGHRCTIIHSQLHVPHIPCSRKQNAKLNARRKGKKAPNVHSMHETLVFNAIHRNRLPLPLSLSLPAEHNYYERNDERKESIAKPLRTYSVCHQYYLIL